MSMSAGKLLLAAATGLLLASCEDRDRQADATSMAEADRIFVDADQCASDIRQALGERGLGLAVTEADADATLRVMLSIDGRPPGEVPEFGDSGSKASYKADLIGAEGKLLYSTAGEQGSISDDDLCEVVGEEIAQRIQHSRNA